VERITASRKPRRSDSARALLGIGEGEVVGVDDVASLLRGRQICGQLLDANLDAIDALDAAIAPTSPRFALGHLPRGHHPQATSFFFFRRHRAKGAVRVGFIQTSPRFRCGAFSQKHELALGRPAPAPRQTHSYHVNASSRHLVASRVIRTYRNLL
jgi:hypothetical protein